MNKIISIIVFILVIVGAIGFFVSRSSFSKKTFTHSSGAYSFKYPGHLAVIENDASAVIVASSTAKLPLAVFSTIHQPGIFSQIKNNRDVQAKEFPVAGFTGYRFSASSSDAQNTEIIYMIPIDKEQATLVAVSLSPLENDLAVFSQKDFDATLKSLSINTEKTETFAKNIMATLQIKNKDSFVQGAFSSLVGAAGFFFDEYKSYANLCTPPKAFKYVTELNNVYKSVTDVVGKDNFSCWAKKESYSMSARLAGGSVICIDSTGFASTTATLSKGYACK